MARSTHGDGRRATRAAAILTAIGLTASLLVSGAGTASAGSFNFNRPIAIAMNAGHLWIANYGGKSVTEISTDGKLIRTVSGAKYGFNGPDAIASYRSNVFVVNAGGSVTELNGNTGALVRTIKGAQFDFVQPSFALAQGSHIWVVDTGSNAVTEISATTGKLVRTIKGKNNRYGFSHPVAITAAGANMWVVSKAGGSATDPNAGAVTELSASTGAYVRRIAAAADSLEKPSGIAFDGKNLWVSDAAINAVTELTSTGALVQIVTNQSHNKNYGFHAPTEIVVNGAYVYVISPPGASPMITQITASTAIGNWYECNTNVPDPEFVNPTGMVVHGDSVWVVSPGDNMLTQLSISGNGNRVNLYS